MTRQERCSLAIERGFTYDIKTGKIYNKYQKESKSYNGDGYIQICLRFNLKTYLLKGHHFAWYCVYQECNIDQLDHINGITTDNRISNLRAVTHQQNQWNRTKAKGYSWNKNANKWESRIKFNGKKIHLGCFNTEEEAKNAYLNAKEKYHII